MLQNVQKYTKKIAITIWCRRKEEKKEIMQNKIELFNEKQLNFGCFFSGSSTFA